VSLRLEVSTQPDFALPVATVPLRALRTYDFTVRAKVTDLHPKTAYYYRFVAGNDTSPTGVSRTSPGPTDANTRVRFAWITCQDWSVNHWQALTLMAAEADLEFVVHVGDYIYEAVGLRTADPVERGHPPLKLADGQPIREVVFNKVKRVEERRFDRVP